MAAPVPARPDVTDTSLTLENGDRILRQSIVVAAQRDAVWRAFATSAGLRSWMSPVVDLDLRVGGIWEDSYDPKAKLGDPDNIKNEILGFLPDEILIIRNVQAPRNFKYASLFAHVTTIIQFADEGQGETRITISGVGYRSDAGFGALFDFFRAGDAYELRSLKAYVESAGSRK
jgi:uncharacterized protein YndB with AHSA1/START domain